MGNTKNTTKWLSFNGCHFKLWPIKSTTPANQCLPYVSPSHFIGRDYQSHGNPSFTASHWRWGLQPASPSGDRSITPLLAWDPQPLCTMLEAMEPQQSETSSLAPHMGTDSQNHLAHGKNPISQTHHFWKWCYSPVNRILNQQATQTHPQAALIVQRQHTHWMISATIPTNLLFGGLPVAPIDKYHQQINLPIPPLPCVLQTSPPMAAIKSLPEQLRSTLQPWQKLLFGPICKLQPATQLLHLCQNWAPILIVSDASVQKMKQSGFAWVIVQNNRSLWKGVGLVPGMADDMYSRCAEAFGLLAALLFLAHYIESFSPQEFKESPINCFCDNIGVITRTNEKLSATILRPNNVTTDDTDVYMALNTTIRWCHPATLTFLHVQGQQDQKANQLLTIVEQLNIDCNHRAKTYVTSTDKSSMGTLTSPRPDPIYKFKARSYATSFFQPSVMPWQHWHIINTSKRNKIGPNRTFTKSTGQSYSHHLTPFNQAINNDSYCLSMTNYHCEHQRHTPTWDPPYAHHANERTKTHSIS